MNNEEYQTIYTLDCRVGGKKITQPPLPVDGQGLKGERLQCNSYYFTRNGRPFFLIAGEIHFTRIDPSAWEDALIKMKMGGVNTISTYVFWIHHEEIEGEFHWDGNRDLRTFLKLCHKHGLYVIVRIGPFCHGECYNGGLPEWLYGKPFPVRCNDPGYLACVDRLYGEIGRQMNGLFYRDGGPVIGVQVENELQSASTVWGYTAHTSCDWIECGKEGDEHIRTLVRLAKDNGILPVFFTATAWGGAAAPVDTVLPLWGGYAYWPWLFNDPEVKEHPPTPEYIFRDYHNNGKPSCYNYAPYHMPEEVPFSCCEMGGGMLSCYPYRFILDPSSVGAMAIIKMAGGCNFLGYYMFHGGTQPLGTTMLYLNESTTPKRSYDFQACIGEYGQLRPHYRALKLLHYMAAAFEDQLCPMKTVLPRDTDEEEPIDNRLRYAARTDGRAGFLFLNNFQDHWKRPAFRHIRLDVQTAAEQISFEDITLEDGMFAVFPFGLRFGKNELITATAQLITKMTVEGETYFFFFQPRGNRSRFVFCRENLQQITCCDMEQADDRTFIGIPDRMGQLDILDQTGTVYHFLLLTAEQAERFWVLSSEKTGQPDMVALCDGAVLYDGKTIRVESNESAVRVAAFPAKRYFSDEGTPFGLFRQFERTLPAQRLHPQVQWVKDSIAVLSFHEEMFAGLKQLYLQIEYSGDVGSAFVHNVAVSDNFANGDTWEIGLMTMKNDLLQYGMVIKITPLRASTVVDNHSPMAARKANIQGEEACIHQLRLIPVYEAVF